MRLRLGCIAYEACKFRTYQQHFNYASRLLYIYLYDYNNIHQTEHNIQMIFSMNFISALKRVNFHRIVKDYILLS